jgi:uncharacterized membrane protein YhaH (DUF805 family)
MSTRPSALFDPRGTVGRLQYALTGVVAFALKYAMDRQLASSLMHRPWKPWEYLNPLGTTASLLSLGPLERNFLFWMTLAALPFIWLGIALTVKRLRSIRAPLGLVLLFFVPLINLIMFFLLSVLPPREQRAASQLRRSRIRQGVLALVLSVMLCLGAVGLAGMAFLSYGVGLFLAAPFCLGHLAVLIFTWRGPQSYRACLLVAMGAGIVASFALLAFAIEGAVCMVMAAPITAALSALGGAVGYYLQNECYSRREFTALVLLLALFPPVVMGSEALSPAAPPEFAVRTAIEVNAAPERVWTQVIAFTQIPEPEEWLFRAGIAYPIRADIDGQGLGAVRHCVFSTGAFVEPITIWDEPRLLEFSVAENPPPMREWSPYGDLHPPHLKGYMVSHKGRFQLTRLAGGRTHLEGVTWYSHGLWPSSYWKFWSDYIIHRIHLRVLEHIRRESEPPISR